MRVRRCSTLLLSIAAAAAVGAGCGEKEEPAGTTAAEDAATAVVPAGGKLPRALIAELERRCADFRKAAGVSAAEKAEIDRLQARYLDQLAAMSKRIPEPQRPAWDAYLEAQGAAFALSPPARAGEPQPELDAANAAAEAQAAELGFSSCSGV